MRIVVLSVTVLALGLLAGSGPVAVAAVTDAAAVAETAAVPGQGPAPEPGVSQPAPNGDQTSDIGSVSENAQGQSNGLQSSARPTPPGPFAGPAAKSAAIWNSRGRPDRLIIVRRSGIDTVQNGILQRHAQRYLNAITLSTLALYVPSSWLSIEGPTARLSATLVLSTGVTLDVAAPVTTMALTGGVTPPAAASVFTGGGALALRGVTLTSADPTTRAPMAVGPGRPFVVVSQGGRLDATDAVIGDLGAVVGPKTYPGLMFNGGSTGSVVRTTLPRNTIGLRLDQSAGVRLENVTVTQASSDGLVLHGDTGSTLIGIRAEGNGKNGVVVSGRSSPRPITGVTTRGNHGFGVVVVGQARPKISSIVTTGDGAGGMEINHSTDVSVTGLSATDEPVGVYTHVSSAHIALDKLTVTGGRLGVEVEKTTADMSLTRSQIEGTDLGVSLGGHQTRLADVTVANSQSAVAVQRGAVDVTVDRLTINGGKDGFIANPGTSGVVVRGVNATGVANSAIRALSPGEQILGGQIEGSTTGIDVQAPTTLSQIAIAGADTGVRVRTPKQVSAYQLDIAAVSVGINIADGTPVLLTGSRVHAIESIRGTVKEQGANDLSLPALSVLGAIGVPLVLLAIVLETVAAIRQRRARNRRIVPPRSDGPSVVPLLVNTMEAAR